MTVGAMVFVQWSVDDLPTRDLFLAAGHQSGLGGKALAQLAGVREAQVSRVLSHFALHGWRVLIERGTSGRALALGVGIRSVRTATKGVVMRPAPIQIKG